PFVFLSLFLRCAAPRDLHSFPTRRSSDLSSRIGYASWAEWFPDRHEVDDSFLSLSAHFPRGTDSRDHWERVPIMDVDQIPYRQGDRKSTRLNSSHVSISYAVFCLKKKTEV